MVSSASCGEIPRGNPRNGNIDALRLVAAIGVIALHVGPFPDLSSISADAIRSSFRWCVPFFFMLTGYYLADLPSSGSKITINRLAVPLRAFVVASAVFLPVLVATSGPDAITLSTILRGTYGHLWYLTALIIALLPVFTYQSSDGRRLLYIASFLIVIGYVAISYFNALTGGRYEAVMAMRELSGIPAVLIGGWLQSVRKLGSVSSLLFIGGIVATVAEVLYLRSLGGRPADVQLFIGTLPMAAGLLGLAISVRDLTPTWLAELGRRESLGIYLYHPLAIFAVASLLSNELRLNTDGVAGLPIWFAAAVITTVGLAVLRIFLPTVRSKLDGMR